MSRTSRVLAVALAAPILASASPGRAEQDPQPCGVRFDSLSRFSARPGDEIELRGSWGESQGTKFATLNMGGPNELEIISWDASAIRARLPRHLHPGDYKVGVYCGLKQGNPYSSVWRDFRVLGEGEKAPPEAPALAPEPAPEPPRKPEPASGPWLEPFKEKWRARGRALADKPWTKSLTILVVPDRGVDPEFVAETAKALSAQLKGSGARRLRVSVDDANPRREISACTHDGVLKVECLDGAVARLRAGPGPYAGAILAVVTNSALNLKPEGNVGPPAGEGDGRNGFLVVSDFWRGWNKARGRGSTDPAFHAHSVDSTVRHEFLHVLGLPHHEAIVNPGFAEPVLCTGCSHRGAGGHKGAPHPECLMFCGANDDDWFHRQTFGEGFGFCQKCAAAAAAVLEGLEE